MTATAELPWVSKLEDELERWLGTPYLHGQAVRGVATDCIRFPCAVLSRMYGIAMPDLPRFPRDAAIHNKRAVVLIMRAIRRAFPLTVGGGDCQTAPGDLLVLAAPGRGPRHLAIVGREYVYHSHQGNGVIRSCPQVVYGTTEARWHLFRIYRPLRPDLW